MAQSFPDVDLTGSWLDLTTLPSHSAIANQKVTLQAKGVRRVLVYIGGASAPTGDGWGVLLAPEKSVTGTSDHFWVKGSAATLAVLVED